MKPKFNEGKGGGMKKKTDIKRMISPSDHLERL